VATANRNGSFSRRELLKGAAATTALSAMPWSVRQAFAETRRKCLSSVAARRG